MKLEAIEGIAVSIRTNNIDLAEYEDDADELYVPSIGRKYVQAGSGHTFSVHCHIKKHGLTSPDNRDEILFSVYLDGQYATGSIYDFNKYGGNFIKDVDGVYEQRAGKGTFLRPFKFSELATDDRPANDSKFKAMKKLGEIKVTCIWMRTASAPRAINSSSGYKSIVDGSVPEKCLKGRAISQSAGLGAARPAPARTEVSVEYPYGRNPFATFIFKYRSRHDLQIEGIIPRSPSPVPLEDRDPDSLSAEEARELVRRMRKREQDMAKVKREKRARSLTVIDEEGGDDEDDVTIESEGHRRKRNRASTDSGVDVVDLTDL